MIREALREAQSGAHVSGSCCPPVGGSPLASGRWRKSSLLVAGSVGAAIMASFCCVLPMVFGLTGLSILGASALFAVWRPYLLILTIGLLGLGFYFTYRRGKEHCRLDSPCSTLSKRRPSRLILWLASTATLLFAAFPYYSGPVAGILLSQPRVVGAPQTRPPWYTPVLKSKGWIVLLAPLPSRAS